MLKNIVSTLLKYGSLIQSHLRGSNMLMWLQISKRRLLVHPGSPDIHEQSPLDLTHILEDQCTAELIWERLV